MIKIQDTRFGRDITYEIGMISKDYLDVDVVDDNGDLEDFFQIPAENLRAFVRQYQEDNNFV